MHQFDWDDLRIFLALCRGGTVRATADALSISHSTVGRRVQHLEKTTGAQLFDRRDGGPKLTAQGRRMYETALRMEAEMLSLQRKTFSGEQEIEGPITLSMLDAFAVPPIIALFKRFQEKYPKVDLFIDVSLSIANLDRREADLALRFGLKPADHLVGRRLLKTGRAVYASRQYVRSHWPHPESKGAGWISYSKHTEKETWKKATPYADLPTRIRARDLRTQHEACRAGLGLALLPSYLCDHDESLCRLTDPDFPDFQTLWIVRHSESSGNAVLRALSNHLTAEFKQLSGYLKGETRNTEDPALV